jgi:hypothetical protein
LTASGPPGSSPESLAAALAAVDAKLERLLAAQVPCCAFDVPNCTVL